MIKLSERVALVGSGQFGMRLTHSLDCNVYLLDGGAECALIDAGGGIEPERIAANIARSGRKMERVRRLLLTHAHADHAAGAHFWRENYGLEIVCPREAAPWVENADLEKTSLTLAIGGGAYPPDYVFPPCPVDREISEGDTLRVGDIELSVWETPGHARGHVSYVLQEEGSAAAFTGDVVFPGGTIVLQNTWDCSIQEYAASVARLHAAHIERLYPGHRAALLHGAHHDIAKAHAVFDSLGVPPNLS